MIRFSKSKLNTFLSCSEKYRLGYELGLKPLKASRSLVEGSCIHHLVESGLLYRHSIEDILEHASQAFWQEHPLDRCDYENETQYRAAQALCLDQSRSFLAELGPLPVTHVEQQLEAPLVHPLTLDAPHELEHAGEITLIGYLDLVLRSADGTPMLVDLKTVARTPQEGMSRVALELTMYAYLYGFPDSGELSFPSLDVALIYLIRTKMPKVHWDESRRSLPQYLDLYRICVKVAEDIKNRQFFRNPGMQCGYCDYRSLCFEEAEAAVGIFGEERWQDYQHDLAIRQELLSEQRTEQASGHIAVVNF